MQSLNLGILAHVDAGKTSLTERLLFSAGVIGEIGNVDKGTTHTDTLDLERQRGITIKSAVASFAVGDVSVNLIDTPGHPDFIAEVERSVCVLDGVVLVISAVERVQSQTRILMRMLQRLRIPTVLFINKIDLTGAEEAPLLDSVTKRLTSSIVVLGTTRRCATREAEFVPFVPEDVDLSALADHDSRILAALIGDRPPLEPEQVRSALRRNSKRANVYPVIFGSAITGAGVEFLRENIPVLLPSPKGGADDDPLAARVFKIERGRAGEKVAYLRLFKGSMAVRDRFDGQTVTAIDAFVPGGTERRPKVVAGEIAKVWGLGGARVGDTIGAMGPRLQWHFAKPTLEAVVVVRRGERLALHDALVQLVEQDPLIALRHDDLGQDLQVSLYGEVQKEVIAATLASEYGLVAEFHETTPICVERPVQSGEAFETIPSGRSRERPFLAGVGLRIDPAPIGSGFSYDDQSQLGYLPAAFRTAISETVAQTMRQGLFGWEVTDCSVTLTYSRYWPRQSHAHQGFSKAMSSIGSDFRLLTPLVVMDALRRAGVSVCEPWQHYELEVPADVLNVVLPVLARLGAAPTAQRAESSVVTLTGHVRAAMVHSLQRQIPSLTRGEGVLECAFDSYEKARQPWPTRRRADNNPLDRRDYLMKVRGAV